MSYELNAIVTPGTANDLFRGPLYGRVTLVKLAEKGEKRYLPTVQAEVSKDTLLELAKHTGATLDQIQHYPNDGQSMLTLWVDSETPTAGSWRANNGHISIFSRWGE